jgi:hypothetical protein
MILCRSKLTRIVPKRRPFFQLKSSTPSTRTALVVGARSCMSWRSKVDGVVAMPNRSASRVLCCPPATSPRTCTSASSRVVMRPYDSTNPGKRSEKNLAWAHRGATHEFAHGEHQDHVAAGTRQVCHGTSIPPMDASRGLVALWARHGGMAAGHVNDEFVHTWMHRLDCHTNRKMKQ